MRKEIIIPARIIEIWQRLVDSISAMLSVPSVMINRLQPGEIEVFRSNNSSQNPFPSGTLIPLLGVYCETTARTRQKNQVEDARKDPMWADSPTARIGIYSYLGFPILWPDGEVFGTICAIDTKANKWLSPSETLLQTIKDAVEAHLALLDTTDKLQEKNRELEIAFDEINTLRGYLPICEHCGKIQDISLRRKAEEEKKILEAQLRHAQKMEAIGLLAGGIAHDFNNILVPISGYAELGMSKVEPESEIYSDLLQVREAAARAADLTRQILAFSSKQMLDIQVIDLNAVVENFRKMIQRLIGGNIELSIFTDTNICSINADKGQIEQVLMNLVVNARDAMPEGGKLTIRTAVGNPVESRIKQTPESSLPGKYVILAVSDTGQGMDERIRHHIFDPFFTTKEMGKGTGLGLSTVFGIIKQHGGNIHVESEPGKGTTFSIYLPQADECTLRSNNDASVDIVSINGTETVLLVEDDEQVRRFVCKALALCGYQVLEAPDPGSALRIASEESGIIHLLLTDVILPVMNGGELYKKITDIHPDIRVLYMSGYTDSIDARNRKPDKKINFIQKPFTALGLTRKIRKVLEYQGN